MTTYDDDRTAQLLAQALAEEADQVDPSPGGLQAIQRRTSATPRRTSRRAPWVLGTLGAGLATAAVITTVVLVGQGNGPAQTPAAGKPSGGTVQQTTAAQQTTAWQETTTAQQTTGPQQATSAAQPGAMHPGVYDPNSPASSQVTLYYVGPQPQNPVRAPRLYAETHTVGSFDGPADVEAVHEFLTSTPIDPDYRSGWPAGVDVSTISSSGGVTTVALVGDADLGTRPEPVQFDPSREVAVQALLKTAGVTGAATFTDNGDPLGLVLHTSARVSAESDDGVRAFITIDNMVDEQAMTNPVTVLVSGNTFEGNVNWQLLDSTGTKIKDGYVTTSMGTWTQVPVRLGTLDAGSYTFRALEYSAKDGSPTNVDDKNFTVD